MADKYYGVGLSGIIDASSLDGYLAEDFAVFKRFVGGVDTSDATATPSKLLLNETAYVNNEKITGTIPSKSAQTYTPSTSNQIITSGQYLSGNQTISGNANLVTGNIRSGVSIFGVSGKSSVVETSDANAVASDIGSGKTAYVNGSKITGTASAGQTITDLGEITGTRSSNTVVTFDVSSYVSTGYSISNFIVQFTTIRKITTAYDCAFTYTYNSSTRIITVTSSNNMFTTGGNGTKARIYFIV